MPVVCVAVGSFHQGDSRFDAFSNNSQCVANAATALAWNFAVGQITSYSIDQILIFGDHHYVKSRRLNEISHQFLFPEDLHREISLNDRTVIIEEISYVHNGLYPARVRDIGSVVRDLSVVLGNILSDESTNSGYLFTGQLITVSFWRSGGQYYLFDSHAVNEDRRRDINEANNFARLFRCESVSSLATLLLVNAVTDGEMRQFSINEIKFSRDVSHAPIPADPPIVSKQGPGRPKKVKRGRPKSLLTTRDEQAKQAKKRYVDCNREKLRDDAQQYSEQHPEVNRAAVERYSQLNPEVNREAVRQYSLRNPEASVQRVQTFRLRNPKLSELRHLPVTLGRLVVSHGPMSTWKGDQLDRIEAFKLKTVSLWDVNVYRCPHCDARLFEEEKDKKKWCCGEGAYNVLSLPPLHERFYTDRRFLQRARAYNDMFAFCALEVSGGYRHPTGLSFFKIEGRMYHQVYNLDAPGQKFTTSTGNVQFVNRSRLYIDDGEERRNIAEGRSLDCEIIDEISQFLVRENPYVEHYRRLSEEPSVNAHLEFELTRRSTHGPVLGDRQTGIEVHAVLSTDDSVSDPRRLTVWKSGSHRPTSMDLLDPLMEPFQYPLLYPQGNLGWTVGLADKTGKKLSQLKYSRCLLLTDPRFSHFGRLSQAWQVEMFARYEEEKLRFIRFAQKKSTDSALRIGPLDEILGQVRLDINNDETVQGEGGAQVGKVYLPSSFTGGPRYMKVNYENAMALVARLGCPTFFLTFTYSATWEENKKACPRGSGRSDPSTACRVFQIKLLELLRDLRSGAMFGRSVYIVFVIEMQMRGLPHAHIVFKIDGDGPIQATEIDSIIRADLPSEGEAGGRLRKLVLRHMIHGPCGSNHRTDFPCWDADKGYCTKFFPKPACETTHVDERGFVQYRRDYQNKGFITTRNRPVEVHDGWVVPYNAALMLKYEAHINLELASTRRVIKYLFKYLMKGGSLQNVTVTPFSKQDDEVNHYSTKRMVGASDACWRLLEFPMSRSEPSVTCLPVHLEGKQTVRFRPDELQNAIATASSKLSVYFDRPLDQIFNDVTNCS